MNTITISFAKGGYAVETVTDGDSSVEVFLSTAKLVKALRAGVDELSLLPKKADDKAETE
jgi:hypothetical protein